MKLKNYLLTIVLCILKMTTFFKQNIRNYNQINVLLLLFALFMNTTSHAQNFKTFAIRYNKELKGDMLSIGNNILGKDNNALNDNSVNENTSMKYIDIDTDASTFSSSSANLAVPSSVSCFKIAYAGLYWGALIKTGDSRTDINKIKLKLPGNTAYNDITGEIIYDANVAPIVPDSNKPYACYADVTTLVSGLTSPQGTYTVANVISSIGTNGTTGLAAGWTLFVVYEDPSTTTKSITSFDGFSALYDGKTQDINISGFKTPPSGVINIKFAFAALNGDKTAKGSKVEIGNGTSNGSAIVTTQRPSNEFFNSSITDTNGYFTSRSPNGTNSLGYDTGIEQILNVNKSTIDHNATSAVITLQVAKGQANPVFTFFNAFEVDVISPDIELTKIVKDISGNDVGNTNVVLGQNLYYEIGFQNLGNDNVTKFTLKDVIPQNVTFNYPSDITSLPTGVTHTYNASTRTILFTIPDNLVEISDVKQTIKLHVQVVTDYNDLSDACSNEIKNQAYATYQGVINTKVIQDEASFNSTTCNYGTPESTNFLVGIDGHIFTRNEVLCGANATLLASNGYDSYSWSTSSTGTPVVGTGQTYTATNTGIYYVTSTSNSTCKSIKEQITVVPFGNTITNPVIPYADEVVTCQNNGKDLPNIFLCGANATRLIQTNISDASTIEWEKLNESSCAAQTIANCANENAACQWNSVGTGANYLVNTAGQFRVTLRYSGGCFSRFYFNVYQNLLNPTETHNDIICNTNGKITIGGVPSGYEYSLNGITYQSSNIFTITTAGSYTVYIRQIGVATNPCIFSVSNILIRKRNFTVSTIVTQPSCNGDKGSIKLAANDAEPQYYYSIYKGATLVNSVGPLTVSDYEFSGLTPAIYTVRVWTDDGCDYSTNIEIIEPVLLTATSALTKPLTCVDGEITVYPVGGTPPYAYYVNGSTTSQSVSQIVVTNPLPSGGTYTIDVIDSKNCKATTTITVAAIPAPVYTVTKTDILCYNNTTGVINFNVTNTNGYTLTYSIDNGATYSSNPTFSNLSAGTFNAILKYSLAGADCFSNAQVVTITQPSTALTASAGVSELAGCGTNGEGKIRITNPQGGTSFPNPNPYLYSFDNQSTWITTNEAYLMPGTYTVYIKDANGCIYPMTVTLDAQPPAPTIVVDAAAFNCDGTATSTVTITNNGGSNYSYEYLIDGNLNPNTVDPKIFLNVTSGSHTISVKSQLLTVSTYSNLLNEDFGSGADVTSPGINTAFCFEQQVEATKCHGDKLFGNGEYTVTNSLKNNPYSGWHNPVDHTSGNANGRYLAVDAGTAIPNNAVLYRKTINDIIPNQPIQVRFFATNLLKIGNTQPDASLTVELQNNAGTALSSQSTGGIPKTNGWVEYNRTIDPGSNTSLDFVLRLEVAQVNGIDFAVDDIEVYQLPKSCITKKDFPIIIPTDEAFDASITGFKNVSCAGGNDGTITIAAENFNPTNGFQYSINGGTTWITQMSSPYTITGLAAATYDVKIRFDASSTGTCVKSFSQIITAPTLLTVNASVTSVAKCTVGATIAATAAGGTPTYQYELRDSAGISIITPFQLATQFTNVPTGTYTVFVKDANSCVSPNAAAVSVVAPPTVTASLDAGSDLCYDNLNQASLIVNASGGTSPYTFTLDSNAPQNSNTYNNVSVGNHTVIVTDSYGCTAPAISITIAPQLTTAASISKELDCTASPNAIIAGTISGGNAPFVVTVLSGTGPGTIAYPTSTSFTYTTAVASTYQFQIQDAQGCITTTTATVNAITNPTATVTTTNPNCNNGNDGQIQIIPAGGSAGYTYSFNGSPFTSTSLYTGLDATTSYTYQVKDSKECLSLLYTISLNNPTKVIASATISANTTCGTTTVVTATATGGSGSYTYSFNGSSTYTATNTFTITNAAAGSTLTYAAKDTKGCIDTQTINIPAYNPPTVLGITNTTIICTAPNDTSTASVTTTNGVGPLTYLITATNSGTPPSAWGPIVRPDNTSPALFSGLMPGDYTFKVTDANGCTISASYNIAPAVTIAVSGTKTDITCFGATDGTATFTVTGFSATANYVATIKNSLGTTYTANASSDVLSLINLAAETYTITVKDNTTGCSSTPVSVTINPATKITFTANATKVNCNNKISNINFPTLSGGTPGYTYAYVTAGSSAPSFAAYSSSTTADTSILGLNIDVYIKDNNNCTEMQPITVTQENVPTINSIASSCYTGTPIAITITGTTVGTASYSIDNVSYSASPNFNLGVGSYTLYIKDQFGCTASTPYVVAPQLTISTAVVPDVTCTANTTINLTAAGGTGTYNYTYSTDGGATYNLAANPFVTNIAGTYKFKVTDAASCTAITSDVIVNTKATVLTISTTKTDVKCKGDSTGIINITPTSGKSPFTYEVKNGASVISTTATTTGLASGTYDIVVTDALDCTSVSTPVTINEPANALTATAAYVPTTTCSTTATVTVTAADGTPGYLYSFNGGAFTTAYTFAVNDNGADQLISYQVKDANGCTTVTQNINVLKLNPPTAGSITSSAVTCAATTSTVTVTPTAGTGVGTLTYEITFPIAVATSNTTGVFVGLAPDTYIFKVTDANGCYYTQSHTITPVTPVAVAANKTSDVLCFGDSSGSGLFTVSGHATVGAYSFVLTTGTLGTGTLIQSGNTITLSNVATGIYTVEVTDTSTGCKDDATIVITQPTAALSLSLASNVNANCIAATSKVTVTASGGTPNYTYSFVPDGTAAGTYSTSNTSDLDPATTNWDVYVKDANACIFKLDVTIAKDPIPTVTASVTDQCSSNGSSYTITAVGSSGVGTLTYSIGAGFQASPVFTVTTPGIYTVKVKDANNCTATTSVTVSAVMTATAILTKDLTCTLPSDATITINATGGNGAYAYRVSSDGGATYSTSGLVGNTYTTAASGTYQFEITDANGCPKISNALTINTIVPPVITSLTQTQQIFCHGDATAAIRVNIDNTKGIAPFTYSIGGAFQSSNLFTGLVAGNYTIIVKDSKGCTDTEDITINEPTLLTYTSTKNEIICSGSGTTLGSIIATPTGGTAPYTYVITNNVGAIVNAPTIVSGVYTFDIVNFGIYELSFVDVNGCSHKEVITMASPPNELTIDVSNATPSCSTSTVKVTVNPTVVGGPYHFALFPIISGSTPPYDYASNMTSYQNADAGFPLRSTFTGLNPGVIYSFIVYDEATNCYYFKQATSPTLTTSTLTSNVTPHNVRCKGAADGTVDFTFTDAYPVLTDVSYQIFNSQTNLPTSIPIGTVTGLNGTVTTPINDLGPLGTGTYYILFKQTSSAANNGCTAASATFTISESPVDLSITANIIKNANCNNGGIISAQAQGGTAPYYYIIDTNPAAPLSNDPLWTPPSTVSTFTEPVGDYYVHVKDAYGCVKTSTKQSIISDPKPVIALTITDKCAIEGDFEIVVSEATAGVAPYSISVNGNAYQNFSFVPGIPNNTYTISNLNSGTYNISVRDLNGCTNTQSITLYRKLSVNPTVTKELDCTASPDAIITLNVTDGLFTNADTTPDFTYKVSINGGGYGGAPISFGNDTRTATYTATAAGTYKFRITDLNGCQVESVDVVIDPKVTPDFTFTQTNETCITSDDGTVTITPTVGIPPFTYSIDNGANFQSSNVFTGLSKAHGTYNIVIKDSKSCPSALQTVDITEPLAVSGTPALTQALTCGAGNATQAAIVTITGSGGTGTYSYSFNGGTSYTSSNTFTTFTAGTVSALVKDSNGCISAATIDIAVPALNPPTDLTFNPTAVTCTVLTSSVTLNASNGVGTLTYSILAPASAAANVSGLNSGIFTGLVPDTYLFKVTDANGCSYQESYTVAPVKPIAITAQLANAITCNSANNGSAKFTVTGFSTTQNYTIVTTPPTPYTQTADVISLSNLAPGTYNVKVTDNTTSCTKNADVTVTEPTVITFTATPTKVFCSKDESQITVSAVTGGTGVYTYAYVKTGVTPVLGDYSNNPNGTVDTNLTDLSWDVYVKDINDCVAKETVTITYDAAPTVIGLPIPSQCFVGSPLTVNLTPYFNVPAGGAVYTLDGSDLASTNATLNAPKNAYTFGVRDANGCTTTTTYILNTQVQINATLVNDLSCTSDATITFVATEGSGSYPTYEVSYNGSSYAAATSPGTYSQAGTYRFRVTDSQGCQAESNDIIVTPKTTPTFTTTKIDVSCTGGNDGSIQVTATNGITPYTYSKDNGINFQASNLFTGLIAGTYAIVVKDAKGCPSASANTTINEPILLKATAATPTNTTCSIATTITVTGLDGTPTGIGTGYYYSFNGGGFTTTNTYTVNDNSAIQTISYSVKDANGCTTAPQTISVNPLNKPTDLTFSATAITCTALTSSVTLTASNGVGTLTYSILTPASATANVSGLNSGIFTGLVPDTYLFQVKDANGCSYQELFELKDVVKIKVAPQPIADISCKGNNDGKANFIVTDFNGTFDYTIDGVGPPANTNVGLISLQGLTPGSHTIDVIDKITNCTATASVIITEPNTLMVNYSTIKNANCKLGAQIKAIAADGTPEYLYAFVDTAIGTKLYTNSNTAILDPAKTWEIWVKDAHNCEALTPITIITDPLPTVTVNPYSQCPSATGDYNFTVTPSGIAPFEYSIGSGFQSSPTFTVNTSGTYNVIVRDPNGCISSPSLSVTILAALQLQATITKLPSCADGDGVVNLLASGGSANYEYRIDGGSYMSTTNFTGITAGNHTFEVRDTNKGCTFSVPVNLTAATPITGFTLSKTDVTCNGGNNGSITASMTVAAPGVNDNPVYTYSIDGGVSTQTSNSFSGLTAGLYTIQVTSARGCVDTETITINEPAIITVPVPTVTQFGCNTGTNGTNYATITVSGVSGGSGTYSNYEFIKGATVVQFGTSNIYTEADVSGGNYTVNVYDNNGCMNTVPSTVTINPFIALDKINTNIDYAITCIRNEDITVTTNTIGGTPASLNYKIEDSLGGVLGGIYSQTNTSGIFTGLPIGNYIITVTNPATSCSIQTAYYVNNPNTFELMIDSVVDVSCFGGTNGSANISFIDRLPTPTNEAGAFNYTIVNALGAPITNGTSPNAGPKAITNLAAGTYTIAATLINSPQCTVSKNFSINQPNVALTISETHTAISCVTGNNDGTISVTASGGWSGGYEFELVGPINVAYSSQTNFNNLTAGNYTVNVRDNKGCIATTMVPLVVPTPITLTASSNISLLSCFGDKNASITVNSTAGGQGSNYTYSLNMISPTATSSGPQLSPIFSGLGAGTYTVSVRDGYNCSAVSAPIVINQPTKISSSLVVATTQTCLNQTQLRLSATGGTGTYSYSDTPNFTTILGSFASSISFPVPVGTHSYYVKDANSCSAVVSNSIKIDPLPSLTLNLDLSNAFVNCKGDNTADIVAEAQGGLGNYIYSLVDAGGNTISPTPTQLSPGIFTALSAGNYRVKVTSGDCATTSALITITEPTLALNESHTIKNVSCNGAKNGEIQINAAGGTGMIQYAISPNLNQFDNKNTFTNLAPGNYDVIVQDRLGCFIKINFNITEPNLLTASTIPLSIVPEICAGDKDGAFSITIGGGTAPYSVSLDNVNGTYTKGSLAQTDFDFTGLTGGNHVVYIRDAADCTTDWTVPLPQSINMNPIATVNYDCVNNAASNSVRITVDSSITNPADVDYSLDGGTYQTSNTFTNVPAGTHFVKTRHSNGCEQKTQDFNIVQIQPLTLVLNDGGLNEIVASAAGGGGNYQYTLDGESYGSTNNFIIYKSGDYTVTVTDVNGCVATATRHFNYIDVCIPNHFTPNGDGIEDSWAPGCTINYKNLTFDIFDRYGRKVASYRLGQYWDGKYNSKELPTGDYWYVLKLNDLKDNREFVGHFTLYR
ncbi:MAG: T9SS type B sorting domain-containing protein [Bacteroidota bacterium]